MKTYSITTKKTYNEREYFKEVGKMVVNDKEGREIIFIDLYMFPGIQFFVREDKKTDNDNAND